MLANGTPSDDSWWYRSVGARLVGSTKKIEDCLTQRTSPYLSRMFPEGKPVLFLVYLSITYLKVYKSLKVYKRFFKVALNLLD